jgi:hypothetical protein
MRSNRKELEDNPRWAALYKRAAQKYLENGARKRDGIKKDVETYFNWWVNFYK